MTPEIKQFLITQYKHLELHVQITEKLIIIIQNTFPQLDADLSMMLKYWEEKNNEIIEEYEEALKEIEYNHQKIG